MKTFFDPNIGGGDCYYHHYLGYDYVDTILEACKQKKSFWVLDVIGSYMPQIKKHNKEQDNNFLLVTFLVDDESHCTFTIREDTDIEPFIKQDIEFTDLDCSMKFYMVDDVLIFPSDY
jgi:hypothetical protein